ncbi:PAS-domain containing protein [Microvirga lenta]|uniref:PAS-domain containing protein n=1 Tax=Microvirga lenta TaxID=2881337 RepID=UPI001CFF848D|nr:PAS-domain containing protein [Microvirga lenta]MCB5175857.1 PAS-domain containing protein [Microvirga lenta]
MTTTDEHLSSPTEPKHSVTRETLRKITIRISIVVAIATILSYWHVRSGFEQQATENLERYVEQRRVRESAIFDLASSNIRTFADAYKREISQLDPQGAEQRFSALFQQHPDGTTRLSEDVFRTYGVTGFIGKHVVADRDLKRRLIAAFDLITQFGPAWQSQFANLYAIAPEGAVIMYWPGQPWALRAGDWEISGKLSLLSDRKDAVVVAGANAGSALVSGRERWSELYFDYGINDWLVSVTRPTIVEDRSLIQIGQDILMHDLIGRAASADTGGTYNVLFSDEGRIIAHPRYMDAIQAKSGSLPVAETNDAHLKQIHELVRERDPGQTVVRNRKHNEVVAVTKLGGPGWTLATVFPLSLAAESAWDTARLILIMGALALLFELFILSSTLRTQIAIPLRQLVRATGSVAEGRFNTSLDFRRNDEIGELAEAFTAMARQIDARESALNERSASLSKLNEKLAHELTKRERAERELAHHRELNALLDTIDYGILFLSPDLRIRLGNRAYKQMWNTPDRLIANGTPIHDLVAHHCRIMEVDPSTAETSMAHIVERIRGCDEAPVEIRIPGGRVLRYNCVSLPDGGRMLTYVDITEQKRALDAIAAAEQRQRRLLELAPFPLAVTRLSDGRILYANARTAEVTGLSPEEMKGTSGLDYYANPADRTRIFEILARDGRISDMEIVMRRPDGTKHWALINAAIADYEAQPALLASFNDISELKKREEQLKLAKKETEAALRDLNAVLETIQYGVLFLDPDLRIRLANRAYRELWQMPAEFYDCLRNLEEDMEQSRVSQIYDIQDDEWEAYKERRIAEIRRGHVTPSEMRLRSGRIIQYQCTALPDGGRMLTYFDITELKRIEEVLRRHLAAMEAAMDGMAILAPDETYEYLNAAHLRIFGYEHPSELVGKSWRKLYTDEERARIERDAMPTVFQHGRWSGEAVGLRRDGSTFPQDISLTRIQGGGLICVVRDIAERHARDEALRQAKQHAEEASQAKSRFLANVSHELRTPLNAVLGYTELLIDGLYGSMPDRAQNVLGRVQANGRHLLSLINDVLDLSKIEAGELSIAAESYSIQNLVQAAVSTIEPLARAKGLTLRTSVPEGLPAGCGDERRLTQVLVNLAGNAVKFTEAGSIDIVVRVEDGRLRIVIEDTGIGISPEDQRRIFEAFQQGSNPATHGQGGTGLGLAISKRIVEKHGGTIDLRSALGCGSTFVIDLPLGQSDVTEAA